jgi:type II secretory pathway component PulK
MKINRYSRGSVSIVVLLACVVLSGAVQALYYSLREEIEAESKIVLHNQLQAATGDVMSCVLRKEQSSNLTESFRLEEQMLYPGQKVMQTEVVLERAESLPGRKVSVISIADDMQIRLFTAAVRTRTGVLRKYFNCWS